jgi:ATP-dependent Clp protease protease subunit
MARISKDNLYLFFEHNIEVSTKTLYLGFGNTEDYDLDQKVAADILKGLHVLSSIRPEEPTRILINNLGGETIHGLAIYDAIRRMPGEVHAYIYGHCYSIAAWVIQAADKRYMSKNSSMMIHHGESDKTEFDRQMDDRCVAILLDRIREKHPEYPKHKLDKLLLKDTYLWPEEALDLGLIDEVLE